MGHPQMESRKNPFFCIDMYFGLFLFKFFSPRGHWPVDADPPASSIIMAIGKPSYNTRNLPLPLAYRVQSFSYYSLVVT